MIFRTKTAGAYASRVVLALSLLAASCGRGAAPANTDTLKTEAVYDYYTGKLQQLKADLDGDGKNDATAFMDGTRLQKIEIDRNGDGNVDRWEYYNPGASAAPTGIGNQFDRWAIIARAEESGLAGGAITRREFYTNGTIERVEEDANGDGKVDKWEFYRDGVMDHVDLDLAGKGVATRRLVYNPGGDVVRVENDDTGRGTFTPVASAH
jgi:hypothetical protein